VFVWESVSGYALAQARVCVDMCVLHGLCVWTCVFCMACVCGHVCFACVLHGLCRCWVQVRDVRATAPKAAVERVRVANRQRRDQLLEESAAQASKMAIERAEEQARKDDLIRQIRALEKVPKPKVGVGPP